MIRLVVLGATACCLAAAPASAEISVATFLTKAIALKAKGPMALFSGDLKLLKREAGGAAKQLREERLARKAAGEPPAYCPPEKSALGAGDIMAAMEAIPPAQRGISLKQGMERMLVAKYPCR